MPSRRIGIWRRARSVAAGCLNETTGQLVSIDLEVEGATSRNRSDAGLEATEGDRIDQRVKGTAK